MAQLDSTNVSTGNTIQANDVLALYDALTSGGGTTGVYDISISGSLTGSADTATSSSHAINADSAITATSSSHSLIADTVVSASHAVNADLAITANTGSYVNTISDQDVSVLAAAPLPQDLKLVAGAVQLSGGTATTGTYGALAGKAIGVNAFGGVSYFGGAATGAQGVELSIDATGSIVVTEVGGSSNDQVSFLIAYF